MSAETLKYLMVGVVIIGMLVGKILGFLNVKNPVPAVPAALLGYLDIAKLKESKAYQRENFRFKTIETVFSLVVTLLFIFQGWFGAIDIWIAGFGYGALTSSLLFFGLIFIASDILSIPFEWYHTFVIEEKYGFNKMTPGTFFADKLKGYALSIIVGGVLLLAFLWLIHRMGP